MDFSPHDMYASPFRERYSSGEMNFLFSSRFRIQTFRRLWFFLAKSQKKLGLPISEEALQELEIAIDQIDFKKTLEYEKKFRHDVMAHIHALGDLCPFAKKIIHLGATSTYVTDNTDLIQIKEGLNLLFSKLLSFLSLLSSFVEKTKGIYTVGSTHYQPAQPTTVGKRACLWLQDFFFDAKEIEKKIETLPFLGVKGATGTASSFLYLFKGDEKKIDLLENLIAKECGFKEVLPIAGQTYTRKIDLHILNILASFAASSHKMATDLRLLSHDEELFEKKTEKQVGSSAMPFKKNPIYSERICGISRFLISLSQNPAYTLATQWLERSLDDSSNKRLFMPEAFLAADAILNLLIHVVKNLSVNEVKIEENLKKHLPYFIMENIMMQKVLEGESRQNVHEKLRLIAEKPLEEILKELNIGEVSYKELSGRAKEETESFLKKEIAPYLSYHQNKIQASPEIHF